MENIAGMNTQQVRKGKKNQDKEEKCRGEKKEDTKAETKKKYQDEEEKCGDEKKETMKAETKKDIQ